KQKAEIKKREPNPAWPLGLELVCGAGHGFGGRSREGTPSRVSIGNLAREYLAAFPNGGSFSNLRIRVSRPNGHAPELESRSHAPFARAADAGGIRECAGSGWEH